MASARKPIRLKGMLQQVTQASRQGKKFASEDGGRKGHHGTNGEPLHVKAHICSFLW